MKFVLSAKITELAKPKFGYTIVQTYDGIDDAKVSMIEKVAQQCVPALKAAKGHGDARRMTVVLRSVKTLDDGSVVDSGDLLFPGISSHELAEFQSKAHRMAGEIIRMGDEHARKQR